MTSSTAHPHGPPAVPGHRNWLPLPRDLSIAASFSDELEQQFDQLRERLWQEENASRHRVPEPPGKSVVTTHPVSLGSRCMAPLPPLPRPPPPLPRPKNKRHSATSLLRRSSAYFKATFDFFKVSRRTDDPHPELGPTAAHRATEDSEDEDEDADGDDNSDGGGGGGGDAEETTQARLSTPLPPAKIAINTTIPMSRRPANPRWNMIQPPVITQYPPKPLQYAPVVPLPPPPKKSIAHRISMPALRKQVNAQRRRRSYTDAASRAAKKSKERSP